MKRSVKIDLSWRVWSLIVGFFILLSFIGFGVAYNSVSANPAVMGHSLNEVEMPNCAIGQSLIKNASGWTCGSSSPVLLHQASCYWRSWGDGVGVTAICNVGDYMVGIKSNGLTTGSKHWFGQIYCCTP